jgi:predicted ATPase
MIALCELGNERSLLTIDEPEVHLHPMLLARTVWMLEETAESGPVLISTHSDRLLDAVTKALESVVLCDLGERRQTRLRRPDPTALASWLEDYKGIGSLRAGGYKSHIFATCDPH